MTREEEIRKEAEDSTFALEGDIGTSPHSRETITDYFIEMAKFADAHPREGLVSIDKAVEWLESVNLDYYQIREGVFSRELVTDFRKAMEE